MPAMLAVRLRARSENALRMMANQRWMATQCRPGDTLSLPRGSGACRAVAASASHRATVRCDGRRGWEG